MNFSFLRASSIKYENIKGRQSMLQSCQGYTACITIIDLFTRLIFGFPTIGEKPPIDIVRRFLHKYDIKDGQPGIICTDQGGELAQSADFCELIYESH